MFDLNGQRVANLIAPHAKGENAATWTPTDLAPGAYLCKVTVTGGAAPRTYMQHWAVAP